MLCRKRCHTEIHLSGRGARHLVFLSDGVGREDEVARRDYVRLDPSDVGRSNGGKVRQVVLVVVIRSGTRRTGATDHLDTVEYR